MTTYATRLQNGVDTAVRMRMADSITLHSPGGGKVGGRLGLRNDSGGIVNAVGGTMNVTVSPFVGWVDGGTSDAQGGYPVINDATATLALAPGDATQARVDVIAVVINDTAFDGSGQTNCNLVVIQGTPGAGTPALPVTCMPLRAINVPAGLSAGTGGLSSGNLGTDYRVYLPNGILRVASASERDSSSVAARGNVVYRVDSDEIEVWNGSTWRVYRPWRAGYKGRISRAAAQNFTTGDQAIIDFSTVDYNVGMGVSAVTNRVDANVDAVYRITAGGTFATNNTGRRILMLKKNGTEFLRSNYANVTNASGVFIAWEGPLVAGDQITIDAFQDSGATLGLTNSYLAVSEVP